MHFLVRQLVLCKASPLHWLLSKLDQYSTQKESDLFCSGLMDLKVKNGINYSWLPSATDQQPHFPTPTHPTSPETRQGNGWADSVRHKLFFFFYFQSFSNFPDVAFNLAGECSTLPYFMCVRLCVCVRSNENSD